METTANRMSCTGPPAPEKLIGRPVVKALNDGRLTKQPIDVRSQVMFAIAFRWQSSLPRRPGRPAFVDTACTRATNLAVNAYGLRSQRQGLTERIPIARCRRKSLKIEDFGYNVFEDSLLRACQSCSG